ncbi:MAG: toll/interleukin-1 receptor domain-containing protein [Actinomycetota bacterium]|nr:toll/interleukin-1 receptor domain-containing protein [Actinomycetota bacterium]
MVGGTRWAPEVLEAAGTCHVFIPLISLSYVESTWCAMEWDAFWQRNVIRRPSDSSGSQTAILPVTWLPMRKDQLPPAVQELQFFLPQQLTDPDIAQLRRSTPPPSAHVSSRIADVLWMSSVNTVIGFA